MSVDSCPACAAPTATGARFCSNCGAELTDGSTVELPAARGHGPETGDVAPPGTVEFRPTLHTTGRRPFGLSAPAFSAAVGGGAVVLAIVLFAVGVTVGGVVALLVAVAAGLLFRTAVAREPESEAARLARRAIVETSSKSRLGAVSLRAFGAAWLEVLRLRGRRRRLERELNARLAPLGQAVLRDQTGRIEVLKAQAELAETQLGEVERKISTVLARAREQVDRERSVAQPTEALTIDDLHGPNDGATS
jgi:hypothetical protein